ncbi:MAG: hypothetical protein WAX69_27360 [Victivallales bacterium]
MTGSERGIIRELAKRKLEIANDRNNLERKKLWLSMRDGVQTRPLILAEDGGVGDPRKPFEPDLQCSDEWAKGVERSLRWEIWRFEHLGDDRIVEPFIDMNWQIDISPNFGVEKVVHRVTDGGNMTACSWDAPIKDIRQEFHRLKHRTFSVDRAKTAANRQKIEELAGDIMPVRMRGSFWWTFGLTIQAIDLIGLENLMLFMYDDPEGLHQLMSFLRDDNLAFSEWCEKEGLLNLNNGNDYTGSGSQGYTGRLPADDYRPGSPVRRKDMWLLIESQETVGVGPDFYREFIFPYHRDIAGKFGMIYYGCCEPLNTRWNVIRELPNLKACSIAPLCNQEAMAEALKGDYIYSRKPNPTLISTQNFDEAQIRGDLRDTLLICRKHGCRTELIMKDVHTLNNEPERLARWVEIAREEIARNW